MKYERTVLDDGTVLTVYYSKISGGWLWTHRDMTNDSLLDGMLAHSTKGVLTAEQARGDFFMHNDYDNETKNLAPWQLIVGLVIVIICALAVMSYSSRARAHDGHDEVSQFYDNWKIIPERRSSCCNKKDCYATQFRNVGGKWYALRREDQQWIYVHDTKLEHNAADPLDSPDGQGHVCMQGPGYGDAVWCAVLGTGA